MTDIAVPSRSASPTLIARGLHGVAHWSMLIPVVLCVEFAVMALGWPRILAPVFLVSWLIGSALLNHRRRKASGCVSGPSPARDLPRDVALFGLLLLLALAPGLRLLFEVGIGAHANGFLFSDEAYNQMIAQGFARGFPPVDLSYAGSTIHYHLGGPLLLEVLSRYSGLPLHAVFYGLLPMLVRLTVVASVFRITGLVAPSWSLSRRLLCTMASAGVFLINPFNVLWNIRNSMKLGMVSADTFLSGMPVVSGVDGFLTPLVYYGQSLAVALFVMLCANLKRSPFVVASGLLAIYLCKAPLFVPIGFSYGVLALLALRAPRDFRPLASAMFALVAAVLASPYFMRPNTATLVLAPGHGWDKLMEYGHDVVTALSLTGPVGQVTAALLLVVLSLHLYGLSAIAALCDRKTTISRDGSTLVLFLVLALLSAAAFASALVFRIDPIYQAKFAAIHEGFRDLLWLPYEGYLKEMWKLSIGATLTVTSFSTSLLAALALFHYHERSNFGRVKGLLACLILLSVLFAVARALNASIGPLPQTLKVVDPDALHTLATIPVRGSVVMTNDCHYDRKVGKHLPLMNAWAPAIHGQQFWACNFMFGTTDAPDAVQRLESLRWFWATRPSAAHKEFLQKTGITHLWIRQDVENGDEFVAQLKGSNWVVLVSQGSRYSVFQVVR